MKKTLLLVAAMAFLASSCGPAADGARLARKADKCIRLSVVDSLSTELTAAQRTAYADCIESWQDDFKSYRLKYKDDSASCEVFDNTYDSVLVSIDSTYDPVVVSLVLSLSDPAQIRAEAN